MRKICPLIFALLILLPMDLVSQEKREVERKIKASGVPGPARDWLSQAYGSVSKVNWYREIENEKTSFEAKFKWRKKWQSVKFDSTGVISDVEVRIARNEIPVEAREKIWDYFRKTYTKYKVKKIQLQWTGEEALLKEAIQSGDSKGLNVRYEIEFYGRNKKENDLWEGLFDSKGEIIERQRIVLIPTDNLAY